MCFLTKIELHDKTKSQKFSKRSNLSRNLQLWRRKIKQKDRESSKSYVKVSIFTSLQYNHLGRSPAEFTLSQLWIGSHVCPLKTSMPNMAISFPSAAVHQCHTGSTMQNPLRLSPRVLHTSIIKGRLWTQVQCSRLIYLFVQQTDRSIGVFCCKIRADCQETH